MKRSKNQPAKKRVYKKKADKLNLVIPDPKPAEKDMEIAELAQVISIFSNWNHEQKQRNLKYLCAKFYDFL